jgi:hypothetical protein
MGEVGLGPLAVFDMKGVHLHRSIASDLDYDILSHIWSSVSYYEYYS